MANIIETAKGRRPLLHLLTSRWKWPVSPRCPSRVLDRSRCLLRVDDRHSPPAPGTCKTLVAEPTTAGSHPSNSLLISGRLTAAAIWDGISQWEAWRGP